MKSEESMFRELVENSEDIIIVADQEFRIRYSTIAVIRVFHVEPLSLLGRPLTQYISQEQVNRWQHRLHSESHLEDELKVKGPQGEVYFEVYITVMRDERGQTKGFAIKLHDITEQKIKEQELIRSNQQLDQVIYKTTHDLKAPLMSALGLIHLAEKASVEEKDQYIGMIKRSLINLDHYLNEMNDFFRNDKLALQREKIDLEDLIRQELNDLQGLAPGIQVQIDVAVAAESVYFSDRVRVRTVLTNILSNAIKYTDLQKQNPFIKIAARINDRACQLTIEDNGIGIAAEHQEKIFDLFYRATQHAPGTGLGLFIVKDTIEKLQGNIAVQSRPGIGTKFIIHIPNQLHVPVVV